MKILALILLMAAAVMLATCGNPAPTAPVAATKAHEMEIHGDLRVDDYYWLRQRDDPKVIAYLEAENAYTDAILSETTELQQTIFDEIKGRIKQTDSTAPVRDHGWWYFSRTEDGRDYPIYCRRADVDGAAEQVILDVNTLAEGLEFCDVRGVAVSPESDIMAYAVDRVGRRKYSIHFRDLASGESLEDEIVDVTGKSVWANDGRTIFFTRQDPDTLRSYQVWRHVLGSDPADDVLVYEETDPTFSVGIRKTTSGRYVLIDANQTMTSEVLVIDADRPEDLPRVVAPRERGIEYHVAHQGDRFLIVTNWQAENFRLMTAPVEAPGRRNWREVVPHREDVLLVDVQPFAEHIVLAERTGGVSRLVIRDADGGDPRVVPVDETASEIWIGDNRELDVDTLRYGYSSLVTPTSIFAIDMNTGERTLLKQQEIGGGYDPSDYLSERLMVTARDGVEVPLSVLRRKDLPMDGSAPLLLYGYGSYGYSTDVDFNADVLSLVDRGFSYAIAHVRGGQEMGRQWYENGKLRHKVNTFTDFIDCARFLVETGYTAPDRLIARGGSAGGLLVGAVANMAPEFFAGIVAHVPFVDVVTTMLDESIPLTTAEWDEWGDPHDPAFYEIMLSYSPYDQVEAKDYPAMYVTAGLHDSQVQYWEPAKWVAKLRAMKTDDNPLLLRTRMDAGHGGASSRYDAYRETAEEYAFMLMVVE